MLKCWDMETLQPSGYIMRDKVEVIGMSEPSAIDTEGSLCLVGYESEMTLDADGNKKLGGVAWLFDLEKGEAIRRFVPEKLEPRVEEFGQEVWLRGDRAYISFQQRVPIKYVQRTFGRQRTGGSKNVIHAFDFKGINTGVFDVLRSTAFGDERLITAGFDQSDDEFIRVIVRVTDIHDDVQDSQMVQIPWKGPRYSQRPDLNPYQVRVAAGGQYGAVVIASHRHNEKAVCFVVDLATGSRLQSFELVLEDNIALDQGLLFNGNVVYDLHTGKPTFTLIKETANGAPLNGEIFAKLGKLVITDGRAIWVIKTTDDQAED